MARRLHTWIACSLIGIALAPSNADAQRATVSLKASRNEVPVGEPFRIEIRADIEEGDFEDMRLPDLSAFEILGQQQRRPFSFSFGLGRGARSRSSVIHTFNVRALSPGEVHLSPAQAVVDGKAFRSNDLTLTITGSPQGTSADPSATDPSAPPPGEGQVDPNLFVRAVADTETAMIGEQVTVTFYLYSRAPLRSAPAATQEPTADGFWTHDLLPPSRKLTATTQQVNGRVYRVYMLRRFAAFPLEAGTLRIGALEVQVGGGGSLFDLFQGRRESVKRRSEPLSIEVEPLPEEVDAQALHHVGRLQATWTGKPTSVKVGDAVTLVATLRGEGNLRGIRLPDPTASGLEILQPKVDDEISTDADRVGGARTFEWLALARETGEHQVTLPSIQVVDPTTQQVQEVSFAPVEIEVAPGQAKAATATGTGSQGDAAPPPSQANGTAGTSLVLGVPRSPASLEPSSSPVHHAAWYLWTLLLLPLSAALYAAGRLGWRVHQTRQRGDAQGRLARDATEALGQARDHLATGQARQAWASIQRAVRLTLEATLGEPVGAWTYDDLQRRLAQAGLPAPLGSRVTDLLRESDMAQFTPGHDTPQTLAEAVTRADAVLDELRKAAPAGDAR